MVPVIQPLGYSESSHISRWKSWFLAQLSLFWACEIICRISTFFVRFYIWKPLMNWLTLLSCACAMHCTFVTVWLLFAVSYLPIFLLFANGNVCSCSQYCYILCLLYSQACFFFYTSPKILFCSALSLVSFIVYTWRMGNVVLDGRLRTNKVRVKILKLLIINIIIIKCLSLVFK